MKFFYIEPEIAGGIGPGTILDRSTHPPGASNPHYVFEGWLGDPLLAGFPLFLVTEEARKKLVDIKATGADFDAVKITTSIEFRILHRKRKLPPFVRLLPVGVAGIDDFGRASNRLLVISERAFNVFNELGMSYATIEPFPKGDDAE